MNHRREKRGTRKKNEPINECNVHNGILNIHEIWNMPPPPKKKKKNICPHSMELKHLQVFQNIVVPLSVAWPTLFRVPFRVN